MDYAQRLSMERIKEWNRLKYGMFIHFGLSTFVGEECPSGEYPSGRDSSMRYAPTDLDVEQWIVTARDAGMRYAVLTTKHVSGHCLWPSRCTDYSVATSSDKTDVVRAFVDACRKHGLMPGFYYCMWDNHHRFGSHTPHSGGATWRTMYTTPEYWDFAMNQLTELCTEYGEIGEFFLDIPGIVPMPIRQKFYDHIAKLQPNAVIDYNSGIGDGSSYDAAYAWPSDVVNIERFLPPAGGFEPVRQIEGRIYYMLGEVCDPIGREWFYVEGDAPRADEELLGIYLVSVSRGANLLLDVPPDKTGRIPQASVEALMRLKKNLDKLGMYR